MEEDNIDWSKYRSSNNKSLPKVVDTFLGKMPTQPITEPMGSPKSFINEQSVEDTIGGLAGSPGLKLTGQGLLKAGNIAKNTVSNAFKDLSPYEKAAQQATESHGVFENPENIPAGLEKKELQSVKDQIGKYLNIGSVHKHEIAKSISGRAKSIQDYWSNAYSDLSGAVKKLKVSMPGSTVKNYELDMDAIRKAIQQPGGLEKIKLGKIGLKAKNPYLEELMQLAPTAEHTNAGEFLDRFQDFKNARYELSQMLKNVSTREERKIIFDALKQSSKVESTAEKALYEGLGPELGGELKRVNKGYSEQVHPLRANSVVKQSKTSTLPSNVLDSIGSNKVGMPLVKELVKQDPEMIRNVIGQRFAKNPKELFEPHSGMREFIQEMPKEFGDLLSRHENQLTKVEEALKSHAKSKNISLAEKVKAENELKKMKLMKRKASKKVKNAALGLAVPTGLGWVKYLLGGKDD